MPGNQACAVESGWLLREKQKKVLVIRKLDGKIEFLGTQEYDTKGLEGRLAIIKWGVLSKRKTVCKINVTVWSSIISIIDKPKPYFKSLLKKKKNIPGGYTFSLDVSSRRDRYFSVS